MAAPALQRHLQRGRGERRAHQHAVAAPGQAAAEPAQALVVKFLHGQRRHPFHLHGGDAGLRLGQELRLDLCLGQRGAGVQAAPRIGRHNGLYKSDGRGGLALCGRCCVG